MATRNDPNAYKTLRFLDILGSRVPNWPPEIAGMLIKPWYFRIFGVIQGIPGSSRPGEFSRENSPGQTFFLFSFIWDRAARQTPIDTDHRAGRHLN